MSWKTPKQYKDEIKKNSCTYSIREKVGCNETFFNSGFLKDSEWDYYAEYNLLCKNCPHYPHDIGIYFGQGHTTDKFEEKSTVLCLGRIRNRDEFLQAVSVFSKDLKVLIINDIRIETLAELENFTELECVLIWYSPNLVHFWDFTKTPRLKVLEYVANTHLTDLTEISHAVNLEYFGIDALTSRINLSYVDSFAPFQKLVNLKELTLAGVMCKDNNIDNLIAIPNLEKLWISPHTFSTEDFAKFEALKFKIYDEYGIFASGTEFMHRLGKGGRGFRSVQAKEEFEKEYQKMMQRFRD